MPVSHLAVLAAFRPTLPSAPSKCLKARTIYFCTLAFLCVAPDWDVIPASLLPSSQFFEIHRNWGHNIFSSFILSLVMAKVLMKVLKVYPFRKCFIISLSFIASHLFFDSMMQDIHGTPIGVPLLWPFSSHQYSFFIRPFLGTFYLPSHLHPLVAIGKFYQAYFLSILKEILTVFLISVLAMFFYQSLIKQR